MSNKIVPNIYRAVIDDVINAIRPEFEEYGVSEDVIADLQTKWQSKIIASHVADFETPQQAPPPAAHAYTPHPMQHLIPPHPHPHFQMAYAPSQTAQPHVKSEPVDTRYMLSGPPQMAYTLPPLPGPQLTARPPHIGGQTSVLSFPPGPPPAQTINTNASASSGTPLGRAYVPPGSNSASNGNHRIPQVDGPSDDSEDDDSVSPYAPRSSHPSLPQPRAQVPVTNDEEAINSELDDSDTDDEEEPGEGETATDVDIVFCTYDKVARTKNKWKCILKDGMIHINGRDYLFQKCTGEFEW